MDVGSSRNGCWEQQQGGACAAMPATCGGGRSLAPPLWYCERTGSAWGAAARACSRAGSSLLKGSPPGVCILAHSQVLCNFLHTVGTRLKALSGAGGLKQLLLQTLLQSLWAAGGAGVVAGWQGCWRCATYLPCTVLLWDRTGTRHAEQGCVHRNSG